MHRPWNFMDRMAGRRVCFKGSSGSADIPETEAHRASAEIAMNNYNDYMSTIKPTEDKFITDVTADPKNREAQVGGQISADIAQKVGTPTIDPNKALSSGATSGLANTLADAQVKGKQNVDTQRLTGEQAVVDMGQGKATSAQLGMSSLASQSVSDATNIQQNAQATYDSNMSAAASGLGMAAGISKNIYDDTQKK